MIQGIKKTTLTPENILKKISEFDIYMMYMPDRTWRINQVTISPFTRFGKGVESHPSFLISSRSGTLNFIDFTDTNLRGDCFTFVKLLHHMVSMDDVLKKIDQDFGLGISSIKSVGDYKRIVAEYKQPEELGKRYALIQAVTRKFTNEELNYWNQYHQSLDDLRANNVYSIKELFLNKSRFVLKETDLRFGYLYDGHWKIYRPFIDKKYKWVPNNVPLTYCGGLNNLSPDKNTLICKSQKDYMVCRKVYEHVCHVQNESLAAFSHETVDYINNNSAYVFYGGDSDKPGKEASRLITKAFNFKHINPPDRLLPDIKDFADWGRVEGLDALRNHFINKELIL